MLCTAAWRRHSVTRSGNDATALAAGESRPWARRSALKKTGKRDEAIASYRKAIAVDPDFAVAHFNLGVALKKTDNPDEAEKHFARARELGAKADAGK